MENVIEPCLADDIVKKDEREAVGFVGCLRNIRLKNERLTLTPSYWEPSAKLVGVNPEGCAE